MVTFLITSVLILGLIAIGLYFWQKPRNAEIVELPPATPPRTLFSESEEATELPTVSASSDNSGYDELLSRANNNDLNVLLETKGRAVYEEVLNACVSKAVVDESVLALASFAGQHDLPVNRAVADAVMHVWQASPNRQTTANMLHIAALTDDAQFYSEAVESALIVWREKRLPDMSATELQALFSSEFWLLSTEVRSSGTGFVLKRTLSSAQRELEGTTN